MLKVWEPFEALMRPFGTWPAWGHRELELPLTNVEETEGEFVLAAELPGFAPEEVKVTMKEETLEITGKHEETAEEEGRKTRRFNEFRRLFRLPTNVRVEAIDAKMADGLLTIVLPKAELPKVTVKTIEVKAEPKAPENKEVKPAAPAAKKEEEAA